MFSAVAARRAASDLPSSCRASTPAPESSSPADDFRFPRTHRLTRGAELQAVAREGKRLRTPHFEIRVVASPRAHCRVGFIVAKHGHSSVQRNRVKRMVRELTRLHLLGALNDLKAGTTADVVVRVRREAYGAAFSTLRAEFADLGDRIIRLVTPRETHVPLRDTRAADDA